jgi:hypothetical protein
MNKPTQLTLACLVFILSASGSALMLEKGKHAPALSHSSRVPDAMTQARDLAQALAKVDYNPLQVDSRLLRLPDQDFAQNENRRGPNDPSFAVPTIPIYSQVACYTTLYSLTVLEPNPGHEASAHHVGFYIVAWKDGRVEKINVDTIRLAPHEGREGEFVAVWPGLSAYSTDLPLLTSLDTPNQTAAKARPKAN